MFGRTVDKIRLHQAALLPADYNLGHGLETISVYVIESLKGAATKTFSSGAIRMEESRTKKIFLCSMHSWRKEAGEMMSVIG